jgi:hypothetical protein
MLVYFIFFDIAFLFRLTKLTLGKYNRVHFITFIMALDSIPMKQT